MSSDLPELTNSGGFGLCDGCGNTLSDREMFHGSVCEACSTHEQACGPDDHAWVDAGAGMLICAVCESARWSDDYEI